MALLSAASLLVAALLLGLPLFAAPGPAHGADHGGYGAGRQECEAAARNGGDDECEQKKLPKLLGQPRYAGPTVWYFIDQELRRTEAPDQWRGRYERFVRSWGPIYGRAVVVELEKAAARPWNRHLVPILEAVGERAAGMDLPEETPVDIYDVARRVEAMSATPLLVAWARQALEELIDQATHDVYDPLSRRVGNANDRLAVACMTHLEGKDAALVRRYIEAREGRAEHHGGEMRQRLRQLEEQAAQHATP